MLYGIIPRKNTIKIVILLEYKTPYVFFSLMNFLVYYGKNIISCKGMANFEAFLQRGINFILSEDFGHFCNFIQLQKLLTKICFERKNSKNKFVFSPHHK